MIHNMFRYFTFVLLVAISTMTWALEEGKDGRIVYHRAFASCLPVIPASDIASAI